MSTGFPTILTNTTITIIDSGSTIHNGIPNPAGIYPNNTVIAATNNAYGSWVLTWSIWSHPAPIDDKIVVSDIGEQWSPNIAPVSTALVLITIYDISGDIEYASGIASGINIPIVPYYCS